MILEFEVYSEDSRLAADFAGQCHCGGSSCGGSGGGGQCHCGGSSCGGGGGGGRCHCGGSGCGGGGS